MFLFQRLKILLLSLPCLFTWISSEGKISNYVSENRHHEDSLANRIKTNKPREYSATRLSTLKPIVDGQLDDECWKTGEWAADFTQWIPAEGAKPSQRTEFKILYDDKNIYVAIRAYESEPRKIQRLAGLRDELMGDIVGVCFDSYHDHRTGFEFDVTAYGQKIDVILTNPMNIDPSWNPVWYAKVGFEDSAWIAEMEIPLNQLRYSNEEEQVWGLHCWRWINRLQEESDWEVQSSTGPGILYLFGELRGIKGLRKSQRLEIMPYAVGKLSTFQKEPGNPFADKGRAWNGNPGLDAKIGLTSNFTVDLTVNPDFGQVESDPSVMNLTAFETFYEEKRPFFVEGKNIFNYDFDEINLFYSRRIGHSPSYIPEKNDSGYMNIPNKTAILSAVKLSGKTAKGLSLGILQSFTANERAEIIDPKGIKRSEAVEPFTSYFVGRVQKDFKEGNTILGGIFTSANRSIGSKNLNFLSRNVYTGGIDLLHQWKDKEFYVNAKLLGSYINGNEAAITNLQESSAHYFQRPDAAYLGFDSTRTHISGSGGKISLGKGSKGLWRYSTGISWLSPGLELNDIGFMQATDIITQENRISYFINRPVFVFRSYSIGLEQFNSWNFNGDYLMSGAMLELTAEFRKKWILHSHLSYESEALDTKILRGGYAMRIPPVLQCFGYSSTDYSKKIFAEIDYHFMFAANNSIRNYDIGPEITIRPLNTLKFGMKVSYTDNYNRLQYIATQELAYDKRYILGRIDQQTLGLVFRVDYSITPEFSIQYYGSPFASIGRYSEFKYIVQPRAEEYNKRFTLYPVPQLIGNKYELIENNLHFINYFIDNPDFNFHQFRSNLVVKWEYRPGSVIYLVWSSERTESASPLDASPGSSLSQLWRVFPNNIFLVKFNYWFSL